MESNELVWAATVGAFFLASAIALPLFMSHRMQTGTSKGLPLPPGSQGWPFLGESLSFWANRHNFWISRKKRFGDVFKSHLFGYPTIVITGLEPSRFVLVDRATSFTKRGLPVIEKLLGCNYFGYQTDMVHTKLKKIIHAQLLPENLEKAIPRVESLALEVLKRWEGRVVNTFEEAKHYVLKVSMEFIIGAGPQQERDELMNAYEDLIRGIDSVPISIPGTNYYKALKNDCMIWGSISYMTEIYHTQRMTTLICMVATVSPKNGRRKACALLDKIIDFRNRQNRSHKDLLGILMDTKDEHGTALKPEDIHDNILTLIYASYNASAGALCWTLKYLTDFPRLLDKVVEEHNAIHEKYNKTDEKATWNDDKESDKRLSWKDISEKMPVTIRVIKETLRLANVSEFSYREALEDVEYEGFLFPKGWRIVVAHAACHLNPEYFSQPHEFDPSRFKVHPKTNTYAPFGNGAHACLGRELANLELLIFIHHLVLRYRFALLFAVLIFPCVY